MSKKQIILSEWVSQNLKYRNLIFPYLDEIGLDNYECYLFYYCPYGDGTNYRDLTKIKYKSDLVIWIAEDTLESVEDYNWYSDKKPEGLLYIERICRMYPEKKFILMTEQYEMDALCTVNNLKFVDLPPICFRIDKSKYKYNICLNKNHDSKKKWVLFNNTPRIYRIVGLCYVLSKHIDNLGHISVSDHVFGKIQNHKKIYSFVKNVFQFDIDTMLKLNSGYNRLKNNSFEKTSIPFSSYYLFRLKPWIPDISAEERLKIINDDTSNFKNDYNNDNLDNYNNNIIKLYEDVKLELLSGGHFSEPTPCFSEKEYQCFYGRNFFIYLNSPRSIQWLRKWGFDVFDDVVNHDYDLIEDPSERMIRAIDDNIHLLDGSADLDQLWKDREERFNQNCLVADNIQEKLDNECKKQILERLDEYSIPYKKSINT
jgi:hypothetical protein